MTVAAVALVVAYLLALFALRALYRWLATLTSDDAVWRPTDVPNRDVHSTVTMGTPPFDQFPGMTRTTVPTGADVARASLTETRSPTVSAVPFMRAARRDHRWRPTHARQG